jgi:hypothetical protein
MKRRVTAAAHAAAGYGAAAVRRVLPGSGGPAPRTDRWHAVTVNLPPAEVGPDLPGPLAALGEAIAVRIEPAPGGKGTELHARLTDGGDPAELRAALRRAKQLLETGEVLAPSRPGTTEATGLNAPLRAATAHGQEAGRL